MSMVKVAGCWRITEASFKRAERAIFERKGRRKKAATVEKSSERAAGVMHVFEQLAEPTRGKRLRQYTDS